MKAPRIRTRVVMGLGAVVLLLGLGGGAPGAPAKPPGGQENLSWFEAKNVCVFRLGNGPMPVTADELSHAMARGFSRAVSFADPNKVVKVERTAFPSIGTVRVNLSEGRFKTAARNEGEIQLNNRVEKVVRIGKLEVRADPLLVRDAQWHMNLDVENAKMLLERDGTGRPVMMLEDASAGTISMEIRVADIERLMLQDAREGLAPFGVDVDEVELNVVAETPRSVQVTLHLALEVALIPAGITFQGHIAVDDQMNAKITGMSLEGDDVLGPLVAQFMRSQVVKYNNETRPLVKFPSPRMKLKDVTFKAGESLRMEAAFGY
jgi:hypothetical protein